MCTLKVTGVKVAGGIASVQRGLLDSRACVTANALPTGMLTVAGLKSKRPSSVSTPA